MFASSPEAVTAAVAKTLSSHGPMSVDELLDALLAGGIDLGPDAEDLLEEILEETSAPALPLSDGRWVWLPALLDGRNFTHRLSAMEAEYDLVCVDADLAPLSMLTEHRDYQRLTDGSPVADVSPLFDGDVLAERGVPDGALQSDGAFLFEPGRFAGQGISEGDVIGLRVTQDGFELTAVDSVTTSEIATLIDALLVHSDKELLPLYEAVWTLCAGHDDLFREPTSPLSELLSAGGLAQESDWVARSGFDLDAHFLRRRIERLTQTYELGDDEALAVLATMRWCGQIRELLDVGIDSDDDGDEGDQDDIAAEIEELLLLGAPQTDGLPRAQSSGDHRILSAILALLAEPAVANAVRAETVAADDGMVAALGLFAESVESRAPRPARPALLWLRAIAHERLGDVEEAERVLLAAERLDPLWPFTLISLARYAGDRSDAERGLSLLRRAGVPPDDQLVELLEHFRPAPRPELGRNQPCWCGSGRKYKVCHLHREQLSLAERAAWLYQKAGADLLDGPFAGELIGAARMRSEHWTGADGLLRALTEAMVADVVLFEGGAFAEFLARRGSLLPADEHLLAEQWLLVDRSVHEVVSVHRGHGMTTRDVRTGDVHDVLERTASQQVKPGELYCARVVPAGDTMQIFGGFEPVSIGERDDLIALLDGEPDAIELVSFLSRRFAPPVLHNTEGESMTMCDATLRVTDPAALSEALSQEYDPRDDMPDDASGWFEHVLTHGMERIRASIELSGDELHLHANSEDRFERVLAAIARLDPSATMLRETREPAGDLRAAQQLAERNPLTPSAFIDPATDPAIATAMAEFTAKYEQAWLDDPIPALAGRTPRQCAADPTRRPDLIRLLDSFPQDNQPGTMSPARLRVALGLS